MLGCWLIANSTTYSVLTEMAGDVLADARSGKNGRHALAGLFRQSVFGRLGGYIFELTRPLLPEVYEFLEAERIKYAIRLPANQVLQSRIGYLLTDDLRTMCADCRFGIHLENPGFNHQ